MFDLIHRMMERKCKGNFRLRFIERRVEVVAGQGPNEGARSDCRYPGFLCMNLKIRDLECSFLSPISMFLVLLVKSRAECRRQFVSISQELQ